MMVTKVRGRFDTFEAQIVTAEDPLQSAATATVDMNSVNTGNATRDNDLRSGNSFAAGTYPAMTYRSTGIRRHGEDFVIDGELTIRGVTCPVSLKCEINGFVPDPGGGTRAGFSATGEINRLDYGVCTNPPIGAWPATRSTSRSRRRRCCARSSSGTAARPVPPHPAAGRRAAPHAAVIGDTPEAPPSGALQRGVSYNWQVVYGRARGGQDLPGNPVVVAAQKQVHRMRPPGDRRHDHPDHRPGGAAARTVLITQRGRPQARHRRCAAGSRRVPASAHVRESQAHHSSLPRPGPPCRGIRPAPPGQTGPATGAGRRHASRS